MTPANPKVLAFDTATEACSAAVSVDGRILWRYEELERGHADRILPMIDELLREAALQLRDLDAIAFGRGPGGFTGVRLATSIAQGLAFGAERPVVPVSNLAALAQRGFDAQQSAQFAWVAADARMHEIYSGLFARNPSGGVEQIGLERVHAPGSAQHPPEGLAPDMRAVAIGRGLRAYPELAAAAANWAAVVDSEALPRARDMLTLALIEVRAGRVLPATDALPVYLRDRVAEIPGR
jgi:tRNA threonylcarbamoyladenosine biosynthesis protein TsaB